MFFSSRFKLFRVVSLLLIFAFGLALLGSPKVATYATGSKHFSSNTCGNWNVVPNPTNGGDLFGVNALSTTDAWAVGYYSGSSVYQTLTLHWDGTQWTVIPSPSVGTDASYLYAVADVSSNDAWAVGTYIDSATYNNDLLIEHWDGNQWSIFPSPTVPPGSSLSAIAAVSANDIWAVGMENSSVGGTSDSTLTLHWDGTQWTVIPSPNPYPVDHLTSISALSSTDIWAVGIGGYGGSNTLAFHWDGSQWNTVNTIDPINKWDRFWGVTAIGTRNVWAVGNKGKHTLIEQWGGVKWRVVSSPYVPTQYNELYSIAALSPQNVWAVGYSGHPSTAHTYTLFEHWDGAKWSIVSGPNTGATYNNLNYVSSVPGTSQMWAVGINNFEGALIEFYC